MPDQPTDQLSRAELVLHLRQTQPVFMSADAGMQLDVIIANKQVTFVPYISHA